MYDFPDIDPTPLKLQGPGQYPGVPFESTSALREQVIDALRSVYDPEIPVNIYDLGLIYLCEVDESARVKVHMTLTAPGCPVADTLIAEVHDKVRGVPGILEAETELVWEPQWTMDKMTEAARLELGMF